MIWAARLLMITLPPRLGLFYCPEVNKMQLEVTLKGVPITCEVDYSPAEPMTRTDPGCDESVDINSAYAVNNNGELVDMLWLIVALDLMSELKQNALAEYRELATADDDDRSDYKRDEIAEQWGIPA